MQKQLSIFLLIALVLLSSIGGYYVMEVVMPAYAMRSLFPHHKIPVPPRPSALTTATLPTSNTQQAAAPNATPLLQFRWVAADNEHADAEQIPWMVGAEGNATNDPMIWILKEVLLTEKDVASAAVANDDNQHSVFFTFNDAAKEKFAELTDAGIGKRLAILINDEVAFAPVVRGKIDSGKGVIRCDFTQSQAETLAAAINAARGKTTASVPSSPILTNPMWADDPKYWELSADSAFQNDSAFQKLPSTFILRPSRFPNKHSRKGKRDTGNRLDINVSVSELIDVAYDIVKTRAVFPATLPQDRYDLMMTLGNIEQNRGALQKALKERLGITVRKETRLTDVLLLKVARSNAPGLKQVNNNNSKNNFEIEMEIYDATNEPLSEHLVPCIESELGIPIIDKTGLSGRYEIHMKYQSTPDGKKVDSALQKALYEQLGLEVVPAIEPVEMLVVERTTTGTQQATPTPLPFATTPTSATQTSALAPDDLGIDIAKITDPAARAAVEQIQQKLAKIQDYQCVIDTTITMQKETTGWTQDEGLVAQMKETVKRPAFYRSENKTLLYTKNTDLQGRINITITDGQTIWSDSGVVRLPNQSPKRDLSKQDLAYFRKVTPEEAKDIEQCYHGQLFLPFSGMDAAQMTIIHEDKDMWIFSDSTRELSIGKNDGLRRATSNKKNGKITYLETISDIKINTDVSQDVFALKLEPGDTVRDVTADTVSSSGTKQDTRLLGASESVDLTSKESVYRAIARVRADMRSIAVGVESYKVDNKAYPKTLQALTAPVAYLSKIPNDPFVLDKNEPYHYRSTDPAHWEGWSVGPDGKDDQGGIFYDSANGFVSPGDIVYTQEDF